MEDPLSNILADKNSNLATVQPKTNIADCIRSMNEKQIGCVLVMDNDKLVGIFTERDVLRKIALGDIDINKTPISEVMTSDIIVAAPTTTINDAMKTFTEKHFRHLPVMDEGKLVGLISIGDITRYTVDCQQGQLEVLSKYIHGDYNSGLT